MCWWFQVEDWMLEYPPKNAFIAQNKARAFLCAGEKPGRQPQVNNNRSYKNNRPLFDAHEYQAVKTDLDKRSVSFSMSIGPVWPLTPFLNWFTPSVPTADKGQIYNLKWQGLAIFVPLSAWIHHFHLKASGLMLWDVLRSKAVCTDCHWISLWVKPEIRKRRAGERENHTITFILCL